MHADAAANPAPVVALLMACMKQAREPGHRNSQAAAVGQFYDEILIAERHIQRPQFLKIDLESTQLCNYNPPAVDLSQSNRVSARNPVSPTDYRNPVKPTEEMGRATAYKKWNSDDADQGDERGYEGHSDPRKSVNTRVIRVRFILTIGICGCPEEMGKHTPWFDLG